MNKPVAIAAAIAGASLLGAGGVWLTQSMKCNGLEEDYVNAASDLRGSAAIRAVGDGKLDAAADRIENMKLKEMELTLGRLYSECGSRAGATAHRRATDTLLGL
jgi:hypothetical protein